MAALRDAVEALGHTDVETYLASGNVVFTRRWVAGRARRGADDGARDAHRDRRADRQGAGRRSSSATRTPSTDPTKVVVVFLGDKRPKSVLAGFDQEPFAPERFTFTGRELYVDLPDGQARSKLMVELGQGRARHDGHHPQLAHRRGPRLDDHLTPGQRTTHSVAMVRVPSASRTDRRTGPGSTSSKAKRPSRSLRLLDDLVAAQPAARSARSAGSAGRRRAGTCRRPPSPRSPPRGRGTSAGGRCPRCARRSARAPSRRPARRARRRWCARSTPRGHRPRRGPVPARRRAGHGRPPPSGRRRTWSWEGSLRVEAGRQQSLQAARGTGPGWVRCCQRGGRSSRRWSGSRAAGRRTAGASAAGPRRTAG